MRRVSFLVDCFNEPYFRIEIIVSLLASSFLRSLWHVAKKERTVII